MLAHEPDEARGLGDERLSGSDEVALWRALRAAMAAPTPDAADVLAATAPLLLTYPEAVRDAALPLAVETMAEAGQAKGAARLLAARPDDSRLALARAMVANAEGKLSDALARYDALAAGPDRLARFRAAMRAIDLRLAQKQITPTEAADRLERLDAAWRGDAYEVARRERLAALRLQAGAWRPALAELRESAARFPDAAPALRARMGEAVAGLLRDDATRSMPALDFIALLEENADLLGAAATGPDAQARLADRLLALDLPDAAMPLLERLMRAAPPDAARGATGARLAGLRLAGDAPGALAALAESQAPDLPAPLAERRALLAARATAQSGNTAEAVAQLAALGTQEADRARADILERAGDLPGTVGALTSLADKAVPAQGKLDEPARQILLRLAAAASRAGDQAALTALRARVAGRLDTGPSADALRLLLAEPVRQVADLPAPPRKRSWLAAWRPTCARRRPTRRGVKKVSPPHPCCDAKITCALGSAPPCSAALAQEGGCRPTGRLLVGRGMPWRHSSNWGWSRTIRARTRTWAAPERTARVPTLRCRRTTSSRRTERSSPGRTCWSTFGARGTSRIRSTSTARCARRRLRPARRSCTATFTTSNPMAGSRAWSCWRRATSPSTLGPSATSRRSTSSCAAPATRTARCRC